MTGVDEHSRWPAGPYAGPTRGQRHPAVLAVAAYLLDRRPQPLDRPDAWLSTHTSVRLRRNQAADQAATIVHRILKVLPADPGPCLPGVSGLPGAYVTGCGLVVWISESLRSARSVTCGRIGCVVVPDRHERPETVVMPSGPCHGVAANNKLRRDATGNSVAAPSGRDRLPSVKTPAVNRASGHPRSQAATAGPATAGRTTSPGRAAGPSEGEPRVLESAAAQALHPTARAGVPHERPSLPPAEGDGPDGSHRYGRTALEPWRAVPVGPGRGEPPTHPALAASVMRAAVSSATGLPTVDLASTPARTH